MDRIKDKPTIRVAIKLTDEIWSDISNPRYHLDRYGIAVSGGISIESSIALRHIDDDVSRLTSIDEFVISLWKESVEENYGR